MNCRDSSDSVSGRNKPDGTLVGLIGRHAGSRPDEPAILAPGHEPLTYARLLADQQSAFRQLRALGVARTDRVALATVNGPGAATAFLYLASVCGCAPLNPAYRTEELEFYLRDLCARFVVTSDPPDSPAQTAARRLDLPVIRMVAAGASCRFESADARAACDDVPPSEDDIALLLHTSDTTSKPKLVPLLHRNLCASARHIAATLALTSADRCLNIMPLFHVHGLVAAVLSSLGAGGSVVCTDGAYGSGFFQWLAELSPTWYTAVPTMHMGILARAQEHADIIAARPLRFIRSSSSALPPRILHELEAAFRAPVVEAYGMTEAAHQMACNPLPPAPRKPGSVGPQAGPDVAIMDASGSLLIRGATGEVVIRGPNVMPGYLDNPHANQAAFTDGWVRTGDQGWIDPDGYLFLTGRLKELINRGGEKVSPREVDEVLLDHPEVKQALTFAIPHAQLGEEIGAAVVLAPDSTATESGLRRFAAARLAPFKVPRLIRIVAEIPKGPTGKPQRISLASRLGIEAIDAAQPAAAYRPPESPLEEQICAIWQDMLGCSRIGTLDTFDSLGGDSMLAARMLAAVSQEAGASISFPEFLSQGTVAALAREIERHRASQTGADPIVALRAEGSRSPLVCIPGHDGILVGLAHLTRLLDPDQPIYALEAPQPSAFPGDAWSIPSFADHYAGALVERFQKRPIHLAGVCFGGVAAYELARQLQQRGALVQSLILLDTLNPQWQEGLGPLSRLAALSTMVCERAAAHGRTLWELRWRGAARYMSERARALVAGRREDADLRRMRGSTAWAASGTALLRRLAASNYRPGPYSGPVSMIRVRGLRPNPPWMGWKGVATGRISLVEIDFCPRGMLADPAIAVVARLISEVIR
jgi:acyl-CoA synthetase (AMP-forming)/AMP-acid ligase II/thioesterase domain-containing protein/acyl carrier protein